MYGQKKLLLFIALLILLVITVILVTVFSTPPQQNLTATPQPQFSSSPVTSFIPVETMVPSSTPTIVTSREELINLLPVRGDGFNIEYFAPDDSIVVTITTSPYDENRLKAEDWFKQHGIDNIDAFNVDWVRSPYVY